MANFDEDERLSDYVGEETESLLNENMNKARLKATANGLTYFRAHDIEHSLRVLRNTNILYNLLDLKHHGVTGYEHLECSISLAALFHDTGMVGGYSFPPEQTRKNHSKVSAMIVLENADLIIEEDGDPAIVALLCLLHSKSYRAFLNDEETFYDDAISSSIFMIPLQNTLLNPMDENNCLGDGIAKYLIDPSDDDWIEIACREVRLLADRVEKPIDCEYLPSDYLVQIIETDDAPPERYSIIEDAYIDWDKPDPSPVVHTKVDGKSRYYNIDDLAKASTLMRIADAFGYDFTKTTTQSGGDIFVENVLHPEESAEEEAQKAQVSYIDETGKTDLDSSESSLKSKIYHLGETNIKKVTIIERPTEALIEVEIELVDESRNQKSTARCIAEKITELRSAEPVFLAQKELLARLPDQNGKRKLWRVKVVGASKKSPDEVALDYSVWIDANRQCSYVISGLRAADYLAS